MVVQRAPTGDGLGKHRNRSIGQLILVDIVTVNVGEVYWAMAWLLILITLVSRGTSTPAAVNACSTPTAIVSAATMNASGMSSR